MSRRSKLEKVYDPRGKLSLAQAFMTPRLRALLPRDAVLSVDGRELFLPRRNPTEFDLVRIRAFFKAAFPFVQERRDHVVYYENNPHGTRTR